MEQEAVPVGFGLALMQNEAAANAFAMMTREAKRAIWAQARQVRAMAERQQLVSRIAE